MAAFRPASIVAPLCKGAETVSCHQRLVMQAHYIACAKYAISHPVNFLWLEATQLSGNIMLQFLHVSGSAIHGAKGQQHAIRNA